MMTGYFSSIASIGPAVANHLWQSTVFAAVVGLVALALRRNPARVRYSLWLAASVKILIPFSLLIGLGGLLPKPQRVVAAPTAVYSAMDEVGQPFSGEMLPVTEGRSRAQGRENSQKLPLLVAAVWLCGVVGVLLVWCGRWRQVAATLRRAAPVEDGREVEILRRLDGRERIAMRLSRELMEPGIFGILRPVLLWPEQLSERLDDEHIEAILAHERMHVRRRDNLTAMLHMAVEAAFWFHPMVWWMERRMVEERERACDEAVVERGGKAEAYAESLLKTCRFCVESPLACVAGVTGADLKKRIVQIMNERIVRKLDCSRKLLLVTVGVMAVAVPIVFGQMAATHDVHLLFLQQRSAPPPPPAANAPVFEVATIKPSDPNKAWGGLNIAGDKFVTDHHTLKQLIEWAYNLNSDQLISGGPGWVQTAKFDIEAKEDADTASMLQKLPFEQRLATIQSMVQALLADRFKVRVHHETKDLPVYALVVAKSGSKLKPSPDAPATPGGAAKPGQNWSGTMGGHGQLEGRQSDINGLAMWLVRQPEIGERMVIDKTGLTGKYDFMLKWTPDAGMGATGEAGDSSEPSLFTALQEGLGLKLEATKGPVDTIVIDSVEMPSEN